MKKQLTKDITRYDGKMLIKFDMTTLKALLLGIVISLPIAVPLWIFAGMIYGLLAIILITVSVFVLLVGKKQGMRLIDYISALIIHSAFPARWKKSYNYRDTEYRITIKTDAELRKERRYADNEKGGNKNKKKP